MVHKLDMTHFVLFAPADQLRTWTVYWRYVTSIDLELVPGRLPWSAADPDRNAFAWDDEEERRLTALVTSMAPLAGADSTDTFPFTREVTALLAARYGRWTCGWHWAVGEGGGGGVVTAWCCDRCSVGEPEATADRVVTSLLQWRDWLEELAERFEQLAPPAGVSAEDRSWHLERAATRLVTLVVDRTDAEAGWYRLCYQVLTWFLASSGLDPQEARQAVEAAIGGRFESWSAPARTMIDAVGEDLAVRLTGQRSYRDH
ncbi:hypothetical protein ABZ467_37350 [Streptomyces sp. NPDC005727]|uniref:hypothetical protein n=1 Tax=Streptomyces sp. NPDC005727 TaxID=3157053 RepID=UPI0033FEB6E5